MERLARFHSQSEAELERGLDARMLALCVVRWHPRSPRCLPVPVRGTASQQAE